MTEQKDSLGDRMKANYEDRQRYMLTRRMPVIVRVDGKAFHTYTRGCDRPYDQSIGDAMAEAALAVCEEAQGVKLAYCQSDECSFLLTDYDQLQTAAWFDYNKAKVETITASCFTARFNQCRATSRLAMFDARAFNVPREDVANYFLWRAKDWERNSVSMYAQANFSHKQLHGQSRAAQHELLNSIGKNWTTDLCERWRNGTWITREESGYATRHDILPAFDPINAIITPLITPKD